MEPKAAQSDIYDGLVPFGDTTPKDVSNFIRSAVMWVGAIFYVVMIGMLFVPTKNPTDVVIVAAIATVLHGLLARKVLKQIGFSLLKYIKILISGLLWSISSESALVQTMQAILSLISAMVVVWFLYHG
ncbi:MAG: hypothetical protein WCL23_05845 [Candidatus Moraniibacteriota bacterium]